MHALPVLACEAVGGSHAAAVPVAAAWTVLRHAANLLDDVQDGDWNWGAPNKRLADDISMGIAWIFMGFHLLDNPALNLEMRDKMCTMFSSFGLASTMGQFQEMRPGSAPSEVAEPLQAYWSVLISKSGSIYQAGTVCGAVAGAGSKDQIEALGDFGTCLGVIRQVIDDCRDVWLDGKAVDKISTLPMLLRAELIKPKSKKKQKARKFLPLQEAGEPDPVYTADGIPEIITDILQEWQRRALGSLYRLDASEVRRSLEDILALVLTPRIPGA